MGERCIMKKVVEVKGYCDIEVNDSQSWGQMAIASIISGNFEADLSKAEAEELIKALQEAINPTLYCVEILKGVEGGYLAIRKDSGSVCLNSLNSNGEYYKMLFTEGEIMERDPRLMEFAIEVGVTK